MKHIWMFLIALTLTLCSVTALADTPADVLGEHNLASLEAKYEGYSVFSAYRIDRDNVIVSMHRDSGRNLLVLVENNKVTYAGTGALPQGDPVYVLSGSDCTNKSHTDHFTLKQGKDTSSFTCHYARDQQGEYRLTSYGMNGTSVTVSGSKLDFGGTAVNVELDNRLKRITVSKLPKSASKAVSAVPEIPDGTLSAKIIEFQAGKLYNVYSAPDSDSTRGADGKAKVSTNDWVQVFGIDGSWIMVQYDINSSHFRIGYILASSLPDGVNVPALDWIGTGAMTGYAVKVTDDPLKSHSTLVELPADTQVMLLGSMGDWSYIEGTAEGKRFRGFVPAESLTTSGVITSLTEARKILCDSWTIYAGGADNVDTLTFANDGTVRGHVQSTDSALSRLAEKADWQGSWSLSAYDAARNAYWNEPEFELTISRDGSEQRYGLRICWEPYAEKGPAYALILSTNESGSGLVLCKE